MTRSSWRGCPNGKVDNMNVFYIFLFWYWLSYFWILSFVINQHDSDERIKQNYRIQGDEFLILRNVYPHECFSSFVIPYLPNTHQTTANPTKIIITNWFLTFNSLKNSTTNREINRGEIQYPNIEIASKSEIWAPKTRRLKVTMIAPKNIENRTAIKC